MFWTKRAMDDLRYALGGDDKALAMKRSWSVEQQKELATLWVKKHDELTEEVFSTPGKIEAKLDYVRDTMKLWLDDYLKGQSNTGLSWLSKKKKED